MNVHSVTEVDEPPTELNKPRITKDAVEAATLNKRRSMIKDAVEAAANGVMADIKALRDQLDELEMLVIQSAERNIESLNTHVGICEAAQIEVNRLSGVVAEMRKGQLNGGLSAI
jgi:hypothetical protein